MKSKNKTKSLIKFVQIYIGNSIDTPRSIENYSSKKEKYRKFHHQ